MVEVYSWFRESLSLTSGIFQTFLKKIQLKLDCGPVREHLNDCFTAVWVSRSSASHIGVLSVPGNFETIMENLGFTDWEKQLRNQFQFGQRMWKLGSIFLQNCVTKPSFEVQLTVKSLEPLQHDTARQFKNLIIKLVLRIWANKGSEREPISTPAPCLLCPPGIKTTIFAKQEQKCFSGFLR